jgi:hypothetical protein
MKREKQIEIIMETGISREGAMAILGPPKYINANPLTYAGPNGTKFEAGKSDLSTGVIVMKMTKSEVGFARDMAGFANYYVTTILPELDPEEKPFAGWDKVKITLRHSP